MQAGKNAEVEILRLLKAEGGKGGKEGSRRAELHRGAYEEGFISGQTISKVLGISRTAVWKHMTGLRKKGYLIDASPSKGYRLNTGPPPFNEVELSSSLSTELVGSSILFYPELESTNTTAVELARKGAPEGAAVIADTQTLGRGRINRTWLSPPGVNLYTSVILRPDIPPQEAPRLTLLSAVAVTEAVSGFSPKRPTVKWPNDVLIDSKKVAGILLEMHSEMDRVEFVVVGIGVNVNMTGSMFPPELRPSATSIREKCGTDVSRTAFTQALYSSLEKWYKVYFNEGFEPVRAAWREFFDSEGKPVRVTSGERIVEGICMGLDVDGALLVRTSVGKVERIISGDVYGQGDL